MYRMKYEFPHVPAVNVLKALGNVGV